MTELYRDAAKEGAAAMEEVIKEGKSIIVGRDGKEYVEGKDPLPPSLGSQEDEEIESEWWVTQTQMLPKEDFLDRLRANDPTLTSLQADNRSMACSRIAVLAKAMKGNTSIVDVDLRSNGFDTDGLERLVLALRTMPNVTRLNLASNTCRYEGIEQLAKYLAANPKVAELNLNENNMGDQGAEQIADALKTNTTLRKLELGLNYITDVGAKSLLEALEANTTLEYLGISGNEIESKELRKKLREALTSKAA